MTFIAEHRDRYAVALLLRVLDIPVSTYYDWVARDAEPAERHLEDRGLLTEIVEVHDRSGQTYGSPRVHATLAQRGIRVGRKRVEWLMREHQLQGAFLRRGWRGGSTRQNPKADPAPDLVNRHAGKLVTVIIEDTHFRILHGEEELAVKPRNDPKPITRLHVRGGWKKKPRQAGPDDKPSTKS